MDKENTVFFSKWAEHETLGNTLCSLFPLIISLNITEGSGITGQRMALCLKGDTPFR